ncbi:MAG: pyridoxamine 5'-phosphate oxidase family protein [Halioglobus sp.]
MAEQFAQLNKDHIDFIGRQHLYFVGTAGAAGRVNVSPKGMDSLRVMDASTMAWLNLTGSGNESAAHVLENGRMTVMFCSFDKQPLILRLYGSATVVHPRDERWEELTGLFPTYTGARQVFLLHVDMVQTSCGYAVPHYTHESDRQTLTNWADKKGRQEVQSYWQEKNTRSLDGKDTGIDTAID